ncbi:hypothetical protein [Flavilitoribacter nigricans]|uniref:Uncharacterized protein n=1 Tax=Flavilitoribacter nigricans (strain ATCC 23147 / DSM 23189 / NBRC 102662 / NCIMB 1420 / SS-2) TaxID=1122177 RepID=A0A2D0NBV0_FLAN2|nr:hypothetical protein [Flavilitoribacter nigricans]PHN05975.1 hypothetical protein CRP01_13455 [Flavilitoribacter nigricans DSM 23189 = NBRC 102662]
MHDSKLFQLLKVLSEPELRRLKLFLKSPFFNTNAHILKLYQVLRKDHPYYQSKNLSKEKVYQKVFPGTDYHHQKLLNLMSNFTALLKDYLRNIQLEKTAHLQDRLLLQSFAERPLAYETFEREMFKADRELDKGTVRDSIYFQQKFWLGQSYCNHPATDKFKLSPEVYEASMEQLDQWYILEKLLLSCEMKAREKPLSENHRIWLLQEISEKAYDFREDAPVIMAYLEILELLETEETVSYTRLKDILWRNFADFTRLQQQQILQCLINFTILRGNQGEQLFLQENLELYQFGLTAGLFLEHGMLNDMQFINIVNIALRTGATQWCQKFIREHKKRLDPRARKDAVSLANALWLYKTQQAETAINLLQEVDFLNVYYQIQSRVLLLKIFYESFQQDLNYFELINAQVESFERYLRRNEQLADHKKEGLLNFALAVKRLIRLQMELQNSDQERTKMRRQLEQQIPVYNKSWLLNQI